MDIETINENNVITPYLINAFDGRQHLNSFNDNVQELFNEFLDNLSSRLEKGKTLMYVHNLSSFDGVLILIFLFIKYGKNVNPIIHNGKIIAIKIKIDTNKTLLIKDSYLLLSSSLRNLGIAFDVDIQKTHHPFNLYDLDYSGTFPAYKYWTDITNKEWQHMRLAFGHKTWNLKDESIKYCEMDCESLHEIITKFNELIFNKFKINVHSALTAPALSMKIIKSHYMPKNTIYQLLGKVEWDIRKSNTGCIGGPLNRPPVLRSSRCIYST
jgi:hypothetical protein